MNGLNVADEGTSFSVVVDTLDGDAYDEFEDNDEDLNGNYEDVDEDSDGNYEDVDEDNDGNYENNDEDVQEDLIADAEKRAELKFQFLNSDYEQEKANQEVNVDDCDFDKYVVYEGVEPPHKEHGEASSDEYHYNLKDLRSFSEEEQHDEVEGVKKCSARPQCCC
ncbi:hypothetical protein PRUPE_6G125700 [Prunus persica]|uniref:Uncharacterized protein n=1 Tax=Prunus persica TaxID=3760 RepID=A0A251NPC7_PRUPE|nr:hypothetical protein PRUPE_6G125700 [Prunus persica]ONI01168.1 hypothetical protein PRUPE_6G125700 [Prunus persica]